MPAESTRAATVQLADYAALVRRRWRVVALAIVLGIAMSAWAYSIAPRSYTARAVVAVSPVATSPMTGGSNPQVNTVTESAVLRSSTIASLVARTVRDRTPAELSSRLSVATPLNSQILEITYRGDTPTEAAAGANAFAEAYVDFRRSSAEEQLRNRLDNLSRRITALTTELRNTPGRLQQELIATDISGLREQQSSLTTAVIDPGTVIGVARRPAWPSSPRRLMYLGSGLLIGLLVGLVGAVARDRTDDRLRRPEQLTDAVGAPLLVSPKRLHGLSRIGGARSARQRGAADGGLGRNGYNVLRSKVLSPTIGGGRRRLLIAGPTSPSPNDGTEEVASGLADALASSGRQVALLPVDPYSTRLDLVTRRDPGARWHQPPRIVSPEQAEQLLGQDSGSGGSWLLVAGAASKSDAELLTTAAAMEAVVVLARRGVTSLQDLRLFREDLEQVDAQILGCLFLEPAPRATPRPPADRQPQPARTPDAVEEPTVQTEHFPAPVDTR